jgi:putative SOS response-associated peptidase YedK
MCYSAQLVEQNPRYLRETGARINLEAFAKRYGHQPQGKRLKRPRATDALFDEPQSAAETALRDRIADDQRAQGAAWEADLFRQRRRQADAQRSLQRTERRPSDSRFFPHWSAPVIGCEDGGMVVKPMRYHRRPAGKPASYDHRYPGCYNARRDNLEGFWKGQFGHSHGVLVASAFYENVSRHAAEGRPLQPEEPEENVVLEFRPQPAQTMLVACLWSYWTAPGQDELLSFAAITDDPPAEVAAAGHDRCIVPITAENLEAWLRPDGNRDRAHAILDERARLIYEHRMAA